RCEPCVVHGAAAPPDGALRGVHLSGPQQDREAQPRGHEPHHPALPQVPLGRREGPPLHRLPDLSLPGRLEASRNRRSRHHPDPDKGTAELFQDENRPPVLRPAHRHAHRVLQRLPGHFGDLPLAGHSHHPGQREGFLHRHQREPLHRLGGGPTHLQRNPAGDRSQALPLRDHDRSQRPEIPARSTFRRMNLNIGIPLNETITDAVTDQLTSYDPSRGARSRGDIPRTCTNHRILAAIGPITGLPLFLKTKDFVDRSLLEQSDPNLLNRGMFVPLCKEDGQIYIAVANPWDPTAIDSVSQQYPELEVVRILSPAAEITQVIESIARTTGPSQSEIDAIEVDEDSEV